MMELLAAIGFVSVLGLSTVGFITILHYLTKDL